VLIGIFTFLISHYGFQVSLKTSFIAIVVALVLSNTIIMRLSRNIWINIFIDFDKHCKSKQIK
jgi:hypothetical protein